MKQKKYFPLTFDCTTTLICQTWLLSRTHKQIFFSLFDIEDPRIFACCSPYHFYENYKKQEYTDIKFFSTSTNQTYHVVRNQKFMHDPQITFFLLIEPIEQCKQSESRTLGTKWKKFLENLERLDIFGYWLLPACIDYRNVSKFTRLGY